MSKNERTLQEVSAKIRRHSTCGTRELLDKLPFMVFLPKSSMEAININKYLNIRQFHAVSVKDFYEPDSFYMLL